MNTQDKVIVVTGGASGLGEATVRYLLRRGAKVAAFDVNEQNGNALADELEENFRFYKVDITNEDDVAEAVDKVQAAFNAIHVCINCAGIPLPCKVLDREGNAVALSKFTTVISVNLIGLFNVMSKCAAIMAKNEPDEKGERGVVINISSGAAYEGQIGQCAYSASKAGVIGLNIPAARELGAVGIRVNAIAPGLFGTPMVKSLDAKVVQSLINMVESPRRLGDLDEFAHTCAYIIENAYLNGETIRLDAATRLKAK